MIASRLSSSLFDRETGVLERPSPRSLSTVNTSRADDDDDDHPPIVPWKAQPATKAG